MDSQIEDGANATPVPRVRNERIPSSKYEGRDTKGRILPGHRPIPHARGPHQVVNRAERVALAEAHLTPAKTKHALVKLYELGMAGDVKALCAWLDRALGKPLIQAEVTTTSVKKTELEIRAELKALIERNPRLADIPHLIGVAVPQAVPADTVAPSDSADGTKGVR